MLVRAVEPLEGLALMEARRGTARVRDLCNGPGKLCQAFGITKRHNGHCLASPPLYIVPGARPAAAEIAVAPRINIDYAGEAKDWLWRFYLSGNPYVSRK